MPSRRHRSGKSSTWSPVVLALLLTVTPAARADEPAPAEKTASRSTPLLVTLTDDSTLKVTLRDERIEIDTRYGKLLVPAAEVRRVEFRTRIPAGDARRAEAAVAALGSKEFRDREAAGAELLRLGTRAYPAVEKAAEHSDAEVSRRAKEILDKIRESVPAEHLQTRDDDVISAGGNEIVGRIAAESIRVETLAFGEQRLRLADVRSLRSPSAERVADAAADPGQLFTFANEVGKTFTFKVTGMTAGAPGAMPPAPVMRGAGGAMFVMPVGPMPGVVWGTDVYTCDSTLAMVAVHAGVLKAGQTGVVKVKILGPQASYVGSTRNGVTSMNFGPFPGFTISR